MIRPTPMAAFAAVLIFAAGALSAAEGQPPSRDAVAAAAVERAAAENLPGSRWSMDKLRDLARNIAALPDDVAAEAIWLATSAPPRVDTVSIFANALSAPSVPVRIVAVSALASQNTDDSRRILMNTLALERNPEVVQAVIQGLAHLPRTVAVRGLMDVMFLPGASGMAMDSAAEELRRLTKAEIGNTPVDWRDWWLDNEQQYESGANP